MTAAAARPAGPALETKLHPDPPRRGRKPGAFEGYASLFGIADLGRDVVLPGAFAETLARRGPAGIRMLWQHDPAEPVGRWTRLREDGRGLRVEGQLNLAVARARELSALMAEGAVDGLSIGFRVVEAARDRRSGLRRLIRLDLWEISIVTFPMLPGARIASGEAAAPPAQPLALAIRRATARLTFPAGSRPQPRGQE